MSRPVEGLLGCISSSQERLAGLGGEGAYSPLVGGSSVAERVPKAMYERSWGILSEGGNRLNGSWPGGVRGIHPVHSLGETASSHSLRSPSLENMRVSYDGHH